MFQGDKFVLFARRYIETEAFVAAPQWHVTEHASVASLLTGIINYLAWYVEERYVEETDNHLFGAAVGILQTGRCWSTQTRVTPRDEYGYDADFTLEVHGRGSSFHSTTDIPLLSNTHAVTEVVSSTEE